MTNITTEVPAREFVLHMSHGGRRGFLKPGTIRVLSKHWGERTESWDEAHIVVREHGKHVDTFTLIDWLDDEIDKRYEGETDG